MSFRRTAAIACAALLLAATPARADGPPDFEQQIKPILVSHCYQCHGPQKQLSGLRLDDGAAALVALEDVRPDVAFLDIRMPKLTGLEVAERIQGESLVVFVTAYDEHAVAAFEQGAADYLLKPVRPARVAATVARLRQRLAQRADGGSGDRYLQRIQATVGNTLRVFAAEEICCFRSDVKYTRVVGAGAEGLIRRSLAALGGNLDPARFWKINRGIIVNIDHVDSIVRDETGAMTVRLRNGQGELPVSKPHQSQFRGM
jgi:DNA-binding LytR/AlgR family response regulator